MAEPWWGRAGCRQRLGQAAGTAQGSVLHGLSREGTTDHLSLGHKNILQCGPSSLGALEKGSPRRSATRGSEIT